MSGAVRPQEPFSRVERPEVRPGHRPKWRRREILSELSNGYTMERVSKPADRELEARLTRNRVGPGSEPVGNELLSLRDPEGFPQVNVVVMYGLVVQVLGPENRPVTDSDHLALLREHFESLPAKTYFCPVAGTRRNPEGIPDEHGLYRGPQAPYDCFDGYTLGAGPGARHGRRLPLLVMDEAGKWLRNGE